MNENISHHKIETSTERGFGFVFAFVFLIICLYPILLEKKLNVWSGVLSFMFLLFTIFLPKVLILPNKLWNKLGFILGNIVSPIIMGIIFFLTVTPTGIIMRLLRKDILNQNLKKNRKSYWINKEKTDTSMNNQF